MCESDMASETTSFETMGDGWIAHVVNCSGERSPYSKMVPRDKGGASGEASAGTKANRSATTAHMGSESNGPSGKIVAKICYDNSSETSKSQRNVKVMPKSGSRFYGARSAAGNTGNV